MNNNAVRIGIVGPESTGKTLIAQKLAKYYQGEWVPEYARAYIEKLDHPYNFEDVKNIAQWLIEAFESRKKTDHPVFFDTEMIITKIWFEVVFGKVPDEMDAWMNTLDFDAFLLCYYDLPWYPDAVRENGGEMRKVLYKRYLDEIEKLQKPCAVVSGKGTQRVMNAAKAVSRLTSLPDVTNIVKQDYTLKDLLR